MSLHHRTTEGEKEKWMGTERRKVEGERKSMCEKEKQKRGGKWTQEKNGDGWTETEHGLWGGFERRDTRVRVRMSFYFL